MREARPSARLPFGMVNKLCVMVQDDTLSCIPVAERGAQNELKVYLAFHPLLPKVHFIRTMQFKLTAFATLASAIATLAPSALAASCYSQSGCPNCESKSSVFAARQHSGWAHVTPDGEFATQQECWDGFEQIIDQCYGSKDGGVYNFDFNGDSARLHVGFCNCE
ncbi:hypothetical protein ONZ51_g8649 [Trametes cubensis]|uniref:Uncharacterized protein n=1 Tax=Trametes cubensis TaxID=1111947 RepID=A0AAD7TNB8_9APHY|nr:hypothetical protein ONZ51_g8649 [Trametes cubensis]